MGKAEQLVKGVIAVPVFDDFRIHAGTGVSPIDYVYIPETVKASKSITAFIIDGGCMEPIINHGDTVMIDREADIDTGNIVACSISGETRIGRLKKINKDLYLETNTSRIKLDECEDIARVIQVTRNL